MESSNFRKKYGKKILSLLMVLSLVFPLSFTIAPAPKAQAIFGIGDINIESIPQIVFQILDGVATGIARQMLGDVVNETITWANSGFEGGPAYVTNFRGFLDETVDAGVGDYIQNSESIAFLCEPLQRQVRNALSIKYSLGSRTANQERNPFQCTLSGVVENVEDFYQSFSNGGWDAWFHITQNPVNNPYGAFFAADIELSSKVAKQIDVERTLLDWAGGALSFRDCAFDDNGNEFRDANGKCTLYEEEVKTPGSVLAPQINKALGANVDALVTADSLNGLFNAILNGAMKLALSDRGFIRATNQQGVSNQLLDIDSPRDYIPDGWDYDGPLDEGYGVLDTCSFGLRPGTNPDGSPLRPNNENCILSSELASTSYYVPICQDISLFLTDAGRFLESLEGELLYSGNEHVNSQDIRTDRNGPGLVSVDAWINKFSVIQGSAQSLSSTFNRYENPDFLRPTSAISNFSKNMGTQIESLVRANQIRPRTNDGPSYRERLFGVHRDVTTMALYMEDVQRTIENDCTTPNLGALNAIPAPDVNPYEEVEGGGTTTNPNTPAVASCSANPTNVGLNQGVVWQATSPLSNPTFLWIGEGISGTTAPGVTAQYATTGVKTGGVTVTGTNSSGQTVSQTVACSNSVTVQ